MPEPRRTFSDPTRRRRLESGFDDLQEQGARVGSEASAAGLAGSLNFDPTEAVTRFGSGFLDEAREGLGQDFQSLVGTAVGSGRLRTGFFQRDAGRLFQDFNRRVGNAIATQSLEASRQSLANNQGLSNLGSDMFQQQADLLGGAFDRATGEENQERDDSRRRNSSGLRGVLGTVAGGLLGSVVPGLGTAVGAGIGRKISDAFGGGKRRERDI